MHPPSMAVDNKRKVIQLYVKYDLQTADQIAQSASYRHHTCASETWITTIINNYHLKFNNLTQRTCKPAKQDGVEREGLLGHVNTNNMLKKIFSNFSKWVCSCNTHAKIINTSYEDRSQKQEDHKSMRKYLVSLLG